MARKSKKTAANGKEIGEEDGGTAESAARPRARAGRDAQGRLAVSRRRRAGRRGAPTGRISSATSSITWCSIRATAARCSRRRRPDISGPTVFRSTDLGRTLEGGDAAARVRRRPPNGEKGRTVDHTFWLTPAHANEPNVWYAGTSPQGLFRSEDGGVSWEPFSSVNDDPQYREWMGSPAGRHARRAEDAFDHRRSARSRASLFRHVGRRRARDAGRRPHLDAARARASRWSRASIRANIAVPRSALRAALPEQSRPALSAEPLRHLSARPAVERMGAHRQEDAQASRRHRLSDGGASARRRHGLGVPDGRPDRVAAHQPGRQALAPSSRATAARPGSASTAACRRARRGGR